MKSRNLFEKRNPVAVVGTKKDRTTFTCLNCPANSSKKEMFLNPYISEKAEVVVILPSTKTSAIRKRMKAIFKHSSITKATFITDILCAHEINDDSKEYQIRNLHCSHVLLKVLRKSNVKHVFIVGVGAARAFFGANYTDDVKFNKLRGFSMPYLETDTWLSFVHEPSMGALTGDGKPYSTLELTIFKQDILNGISYHCKKISPAWKTPEKYCHVLDEDEACTAMEFILEGNYTDFVAIDIEATGLKPYRDGHSITSCAIAIRPDYSFSFLMTSRTTELLRRILVSYKIPKVAANNPYEYKMTRSLIPNCTINNLIYDCCLGQHMLDLRGGVVSVKFQARQRFGITDYEKSMKKYLVPSEEETNENGANAINTIHKAPTNGLLLYNAMDSLLEYWIARDAMEELGL